jgi:alpha-galactosidase
MKQFALTAILILFARMLPAATENHLYTVETKNTMMIFSGEAGSKFLFQYFGKKLDDISQFESSGIQARTEAYPGYGIDCTEEKPLQATHSDGNLSLDLYLQGVEKSNPESNVSLTKITLTDNKYPFTVELYYKAYYNEDVIETWTEISHKEKKPVTLHKFASFYMPVRSFNAWLTHFHGNWADEFGMTEDKLERGMMVIKNHEGIRNSQTDNASFMLSLDGKPEEDKGEVIAGTLVYTGNYKIEFDMSQKNRINVVAGINEDESEYRLENNEVFKTPGFLLTYSSEGKGQASRNFHSWGRNYGIIDGHKERSVLLNSWEGVYFNITEDKMLGMIDDIAALGGELFVMDDGWFGEKYPRNDETTSLGDWGVNPRKLPGGLDPLIKRAGEKGIKFGIWLEPEMVNEKSELYEKHPDWVIHQPNRETVKGRGGSQMTLDMANPEVQDHVYHIIHDLLLKYPGIGYIKWDANHFISNQGSIALPADKQSHLYIEYHRGLQKTLDRLRKDHPDVVMQSCASGGGRANYGYLKYFHEFWTSDNTDALSRLYMQWGTSHIFPALTMASHVSASPNHQTGRMIPLKFRFDVAMTGRLGMEMQPKDLTPEELEFSKKAIATYKSIRPVVQLGDLYRLISPFDGFNMASLMYVTPGKERAVLFAYNLDRYLSYKYPPVKLNGLDPKKRYKVTEINREAKSSRLPAEGKVFTGEFLMNAGIQVNMNKALQSTVIELSEAK